MAQLSDHFPVDQRRSFIESTLKPGCVVRLTVKFPKITKPKFLVLVADMSGIKGKISSHVRSRIVRAVKAAKTIDRDKKDRIISKLGGGERQ